MRKFSKEERSSWKYFWAHWCAFQMTALTLRCWKFKYLFHDWYKPWLKMFGMKYEKIQKIHRYNSNHHIEYLLTKTINDYTKTFDWEQLVIDWECSQYTKDACQYGAYEEMINYLSKYNKPNYEWLETEMLNNMIPIIEKFDIKYNRFFSTKEENILHNKK